MKRRTFLRSAALLPFALKSASFAVGPRTKELHADVVVIGGGTGGCAAALAAARAGHRVAIIGRRLA